MRIKVRSYNDNNQAAPYFDELPCYLCKGIFHNTTVDYILNHPATEVSLINSDRDSTYKDYFHMVLNEGCNEDDVKSFMDILNKYIPFPYKRITFHEFSNNDYNRNKLFIFEMKPEYVFGTHHFTYDFISFIYNDLTQIIAKYCYKDGFTKFNSKTYSKFYNSTILIKKSDRYRPGSEKIDAPIKRPLLLYLIGNIVINNKGVNCKTNDMLQNCEIINKLFYEDIFFRENNRYSNLLKVLFALDKIGLEKFNFPKIVKKIISQYCLAYKGYFKKASWSFAMFGLATKNATENIRSSLVYNF